MTGIVIITAGREDAYQDYKRSVDDGHAPEEFKQFLDSEYVERITDPESGSVHVWGTSVDGKWRAVESGDIALVYREGGYIAQGTVVDTLDNQDLAEHLFRIEGNPWDSEKPWNYLTFLVGVEEIDVDITEFNELFDYDPKYIPQGYTRVADHRLKSIERDYGSVETAVKELTGVGIRVHEIEEEEEEELDDEDEFESTLGDEIVAASVDGDDADRFEELVAKAFSRLGFTSRWIEGGSDTDVEITEPIHAIVEVKARSSGTLRSPDASRIQGHKERRKADHAIVVAPSFDPAAIEDADREDIVLIPADHLRDLLDRRQTYGLSPELISEYLVEPGAVQDDRLDQLDEGIRNRRRGAEELIAVIRALERADDYEGTPERLRLILKGMYDDREVPETPVIEQSLHLLAHPSIALATLDDEQFQLTTTTEQAVFQLQKFDQFIDEARESFEFSS